MTLQENCGTCRFSTLTVKDDGPSLVCRRYPPTIVVLDGEPAALILDVEASDWCGEWKGGRIRMWKDYLGREHYLGCHFDCRLPDCGCAGDCNCKTIAEKEKT